MFTTNESKINKYLNHKCHASTTISPVGCSVAVDVLDELPPAATVLFAVSGEVTVGEEVESRVLASGSGFLSEPLAASSELPDSLLCC